MAYVCDGYTLPFVTMISDRTARSFGKSSADAGNDGKADKEAFQARANRAMSTGAKAREKHKEGYKYKMKRLDSGDYTAGTRRKDEETKSNDGVGYSIFQEEWGGERQPSYDDWVKRMRSSGVWGGNTPLMAAANRFGVTINVVSAGPTETYLASINPQYTYRDDIWLAYLNGNHCRATEQLDDSISPEWPTTTNYTRCDDLQDMKKKLMGAKRGG